MNDSQKRAFYTYLRKKTTGVFGTSLSSVQVEVMEATFDAAPQNLSIYHLAYIFATQYHEAKMKPVRESLYFTTSKALINTWPNRFNASNASAYLRNSRKVANFAYGDRLGNRGSHTDDGYFYRGGGTSQETGRDNYRTASDICGVDLVSNPDLILEPVVAAQLSVQGHIVGRWRGYKLSDFDKDWGFDAYNARAIVNADTKRVGNTVKGYYKYFLDALKASDYSSSEVVSTPVIVTPEPTPVETETVEPVNIFVVLWKALMGVK